ncbi:hypothetical protein [Micromonospora sp. URMC 103]|uniref:hypothetical protein n=1 Tax=Micromonospora sp. URMC 103 TaxID=3423406 RepID=UPI003F1C109B
MFRFLATVENIAVTRPLATAIMMFAAYSISPGAEDLMINEGAGEEPGGWGSLGP